MGLPIRAVDCFGRNAHSVDSPALRVRANHVVAVDEHLAPPSLREAVYALHIQSAKLNGSLEAGRHVVSPLHHSNGRVLPEKTEKVNVDFRFFARP